MTDTFSGTVIVGGAGTNGYLSVKDASGNITVRLIGRQGYVTADGPMRSGGNGKNGYLSVRDASGNITVRLIGSQGRVTADGLMQSGGDGKNGGLYVKDSAGNTTVRLIGSQGRVIADGLMQSGGDGKNGGLTIKNSNGQTKITLDGASGDVLLMGADCAERFPLVEGCRAEPGTVLVIRDGGRLAPCQQAYDRRVAGIISGAGEVSPGIVLGHDPDNADRPPVALSGTAWCLVDADAAPITVGDLLTTSDTRGHAMKATERDRAFGAVLGKAMASLAEGRATIPVLVALQ